MVAKCKDFRTTWKYGVVFKIEIKKMQILRLHEGNSFFLHYHCNVSIVNSKTYNRSKSLCKQVHVCRSCFPSILQQLHTRMGESLLAVLVYNLHEI